MKHLETATILITGGSKGIGLAIAEEFARHEHNLILVARNQEDLDKAAKSIEHMSDVNVMTIAMDLAGQLAPDELFQQLSDAGIQVDILVNNAGVGMVGSFAESDNSGMNSMLHAKHGSADKVNAFVPEAYAHTPAGTNTQCGVNYCLFYGSPKLGGLCCNQTLCAGI